MIVVYGAGPAWGVGDFSPASLKLKTYLRMAGIPYEARLGVPLKGPTKKIPYIDDDGKRIGDSSLIIEYLKSRHGDTLDQKWSARDRAHGQALRRLVEDGLFWGIVLSRWFDDQAYGVMSRQVAKALPRVAAPLILRVIRSSIKRNAWGHGIGRLPEAARWTSLEADVDALSTWLGDRPYVLGDEPSSYDATVYGHLANILAFPVSSPIKRYTEAQDNLVRYCTRMTAQYWKDAVSS